MDRFDCYELCVQGVRWVVPFLRAVHGHEARVLREDFCGTAALSRRWVADLAKHGLDGAAVGVDLDAFVLDKARRSADMHPAVRLMQADAVGMPVVASDACDVIFVGNFSIGYIHERATLVAYLRKCVQRLKLGAAGFGGGVMVCDVYDAPGKFDLGVLKRTHPGRGKEIVHYTWERRHGDVLTGMVTNAIHFRIVVDGDVVDEITDAFVYHWRMWSIAELREAMREAGFVDTQVYQQIGERPEPITDGSQLGPSGIVCVAGRV